MNPLEALNLLVQAASLARLTKQEHVQIEQAAVVLDKAIGKKSDEGEEDTPEAEDAPTAP